MRVKNWSEFQHYKDRKPPWIKLHRDLLDNYEFHCLQDASKALLPMLWLLASESEDGTITDNLTHIGFRLRRTPDQIEEALKPLIDSGFVVGYSGASATLARDKQSAMPEVEVEVETEEELDSVAIAPRKTTPVKSQGSRLPEEFIPLPEHYELAKDLGINVEMEFQRFRDYWLGASGARARKCDWPATLRNWLRTAAERRGRNDNYKTTAQLKTERSHANIDAAFAAVAAAKDLPKLIR